MPSAIDRVAKMPELVRMVTRCLEFKTDLASMRLVSRTFDAIAEEELWITIYRIETVIGLLMTDNVVEAGQVENAPESAWERFFHKCNLVKKIYLLEEDDVGDAATINAIKAIVGHPRFTGHHQYLTPRLLKIFWALPESYEWIAPYILTQDVQFLHILDCQPTPSGVLAHASCLNKLEWISINGSLSARCAVAFGSLMSTLQTLLVVVNDEHTDPMDAREELEGVTDFLRVQSLAKLERLEIETILPQPSDLCYLMETIAEQCPSLTKLKLCGRPADHDHGTGAETPAPPTFAKTLFPLLRVYSMTHLDITLPWRIAMGPSEAESAIQNWASLRTLRMTGADEACAREFESSKGVSLEALCILAVGMPSLEALVVDITTTTTEIDTVLKPDRRFMDGTWLAVKLENIGRTPTPGKFHEDGGATRTIEFLSESISSILSRDDNPTLDEQPDGGARAITGKAAVLVELKAPSEEASGLINAFNEDW